MSRSESRLLSRQCDACNSDLLRTLNNRGTFRAQKCAHCGLVQTSPIPDEAQLKLYYRNFSFLQPDPSSVHAQVASIRQSLMHHIGSAGQDQSFLDYGGGFGLYAKAAIDLGWNATLFDYDTGALDFAATHLGLKRCFPDTHHIHDSSFDVIWAFHVAEHWRSITDSINELHRLLKPGAKLIVVTPNA